MFTVNCQSESAFPNAFAVIDVWNNSQLNEKKQLPLEAYDYSNGKKFRAGANTECVNITDNEFLKKAVSVEELSTVDFEGKYNALVDLVQLLTGFAGMISTLEQSARQELLL